MDEYPTQLSAYGSILLMGIIGIVLVSVTIFMAKILAPNKPNPIKLSTYECGEDTIGSSWVQFNPRFYIIALVFLLFDVELIFLFPWATVFGNAEFIATDSRWGWFTMVEMAIFIGILILGLVYVWVRGDLNWVKPTHVKPSIQVNIPTSAYDTLNNKVYPVKDYKAEEKVAAEDNQPKVEAAKASIGFKPRFKKS